ncbi:MAG TPA: ferrous iron transport protein A [Firmicutes bacterium]|nr:ferrous iron transport protein A [Bacillota bacterium]
MPLPFAPIGKQLRIVKIRGEEKNNKHLAALGLVPGESILLMSEQNGAVVINVKESRLGLDRAVSMGIEVVVIA